MAEKRRLHQATFVIDILSKYLGLLQCLFLSLERSTEILRCLGSTLFVVDPVNRYIVLYFSQIQEGFSRFGDEIRPLQLYAAI